MLNFPRRIINAGESVGEKGVTATTSGFISGATAAFASASNAALSKLTNAVLIRVPGLFLNPSFVYRAALTLAFAFLKGVLTSVGQFPVIRERVISNPANIPTLWAILSHLGSLARFLVDLIEAEKCEILANFDPDKELVFPESNQYNELNLDIFMNRHAAICQLQRLVKSIIYIFEDISENKTLRDMRMGTENQA